MSSSCLDVRSLGYISFEIAVAFVVGGPVCVLGECPDILTMVLASRSGALTGVREFKKRLEIPKLRVKG